jgi:hypothetical protein
MEENYRKMFLTERVQRLRTEMTLLQERFSTLQIALQEAEKELKLELEKNPEEAKEEAKEEEIAEEN